MKIKKESAITINLTLKEKEEMQSVYDTLKDIMIDCGKLHKLISTQSGEVIGMEEIPRVLGILSGFIESNAWTLR
jgi:hypothetical protein